MEGDYCSFKFLRPSEDGAFSHCFKKELVSIPCYISTVVSRNILEEQYFVDV